jgi:hypothetical protein
MDIDDFMFNKMNGPLIMIVLLQPQQLHLIAFMSEFLQFVEHPAFQQEQLLDLFLLFLFKGVQL